MQQCAAFHPHRGARGRRRALPWRALAKKRRLPFNAARHANGTRRLRRSGGLLPRSHARAAAGRCGARRAQAARAPAAKRKRHSWRRHWTPRPRGRAGAAQTWEWRAEWRVGAAPRGASSLGAAWRERARCLRNVPPCLCRTKAGFAQCRAPPPHPPSRRTALLRAGAAMADCPLGLAAGSSAKLAYGPGFTHEKLQLLEVDEELLQEIIRTGVVIKGAPADEAVLCTASKTFVLKQVETSNTLLLIPPAVRRARRCSDADTGAEHCPRRARRATQTRTCTLRTVRPPPARPTRVKISCPAWRSLVPAAATRRRSGRGRRRRAAVGGCDVLRHRALRGC